MFLLDSLRKYFIFFIYIFHYQNLFFVYNILHTLNHPSNFKKNRLLFNMQCFSNITFDILSPCVIIVTHLQPIKSYIRQDIESRH